MVIYESREEVITIRDLARSLKIMNDKPPITERRYIDEFDRLFLPDNRTVEDMISHKTKGSLANRIIQVAEAFEAVGKTPTEDELSLRIFGLKLSKLRRRKGLSLEQLAEKSKVDADTLFAMEMGYVPLNQVITNLRPIGDALGDYQVLDQLLEKLTKKDC